MNTILKIDNLTKIYSDKPAVNNLSFEVEEGDLFGFLGPNGAGKTTTLSILLGLIRPTSGDFTIFGEPSSNLKKIKKQMGALIESPAFYDYMTALDNLNLFIKFYDVPKNHAMELLEYVDLDKVANKKVGTFSHGMKQRLWIAQALMGFPKLIILDEPTNGLDPEGSHDIWTILHRLVQERKTTIVISSHLLHEVEEGCKTVCIISEGQKIACGSVKELLSRAADSIEVEFEDIDKDKLKEFLSSHKHLEITETTDTGNFHIIQIKINNQTDPAKINSDLNSAGFNVRSFYLKRKTLKEYFLDIMNNNKERKPD